MVGNLEHLGGGIDLLHGTCWGNDRADSLASRLFLLITGILTMGKAEIMQKTNDNLIDERWHSSWNAMINAPGVRN